MNFTKFYFILLLIVPFPAFAENQMGSLTLTFEYTNGDRLDPYETSLIIYQNNKENLFKEISHIETNPFEVFLPVGYNYKIEPIINGIHLDLTLIDFDVPDKSAKINIPLSGGIKFQVLHSDNYTPIDGALVSIKSQDGKEWKQSVTDKNGETMRFWIQSTQNSQGYYIAETSLGSKITHSYLPVHIQPGISQDIKITTDFPKIIQRIDLSIFKETQNKLGKNDGKFSVELFDTENNLVSKASVNRFGEALIPLVKIGEYDLKIINVTGYPEKLWHSEKIIVKNEVESIKIFGTQSELDDNIKQGLTEIQNTPELNCQCVAFRLDDIQDYWLNEVQINLIQTFKQKQIPLTIGVIADMFGEDSKLVDEIRHYINSNFDLEIANHGFGNEPLINFDKETQNGIISDSQEKISSILKVKPISFVPSQNKFNDDTIEILKENGITHLSSSLLQGDKPPFSLDNQEFYRFPETATTGNFDTDIGLFVGVQSETTLRDVQDSINKYGFAVVTMHPQEFSKVADGSYQNSLDLDQMEQLEILLKEIENND